MEHENISIEEHSQEESDSRHHSTSVNKKKLLIAVVPFIFSLLIMIAHFGAFDLPSFMKNPWWMFSWATFTLILLGSDYIKPLFELVRNKKFSISIYLSIAVVVSYIYSLVWMGIYYNEHDKFMHYQLFDATIEIMFIIYIGYLIEEVISKKVKKDIDSMLSLFAKQAHLWDGKKEILVKPEELKIGDLIKVKNGEKFPVDGVIVNGATVVDESSFTGESVPIHKIKNSYVLAGSISNGEIVSVRVTKTLEDSMISKVVHGINTTREQKIKTDKISDKLSKIIVPLIFIVGLAAGIYWGFQGSEWTKGIEVFITTIIAACPMAFLLLTPSASLISSGIAIKKGIIFNSTKIFENSKKIDTIVFDKTGTLTEGKLKVINKNIEKKYFSIIKTMEEVSTHPIATSIVKDLKSYKSLKIKTIEIPGYGVKCINGSIEYFFGSLKYVKKVDKNYKDSPAIKKAKSEGSIFSYLVVNKKIIGSIELKDNIRKEAKQVIGELQKRNIEIYMLSGDNKDNAFYVGTNLGIKEDKIIAELKPKEKSEYIKNLQKSNKFVAFVGDGINDSIALEQANVGVSMGEGSDLAIESSDITLKVSNLNLLIEALHITTETLNTIYIGFVIAITYILVMLGVMASGLATPMFGAVSMVINDILPLIISSTLFRLK